MRFHTLLLAIALMLPGPLWAVTNDTLKRAWQPPIELAGQGEPERALPQLREYIALQRMLVANTRLHPDTQRFLEQFWQSTQDFNLTRLYRLLPEELADWRMLDVHGGIQDGAYRIGPKPQGDAQIRDTDLGDLSAQIRARRVTTDRTQQTHYLLRGNVSMGIGPVQWSSVVRAGRQSLRLMTQPDPAFDDARNANRFRSQVATMNPGLDRQEVAILAPLWASYPAIWQQLSSIGEIEQILSDATTGGDGQRVRAVFRIHPGQLENAYPELAGYMRRLDDLLKTTLTVRNTHGRLLRTHLDTETLRVEVSMLVADGNIIPVKDGAPQWRAPRFTPEQPMAMTAHVESRFNILGIITDVTDMQARIQYQPTPAGARFHGQMDRPPHVSVSGHAFGFIPPSLIDVFIPSRIDSLVTEFLTVATQGNHGDGITGTVSVHGTQPGESTRLQLSGAFEALDNFLVRIGMGIINDRVIPDAPVSEDIQKLITDTHNAFEQDLSRYQQTVSSEVQ